MTFEAELIEYSGSFSNRFFTCIYRVASIHFPSWLMVGSTWSVLLGTDGVNSKDSDVTILFLRLEGVALCLQFR